MPCAICPTTHLPRGRNRGRWKMGAVAAGLQFVDLAGRELLLFAGIWIFVGLVDELAVDILWVWLKGKGRGKAMPFSGAQPDAHFRAAVLIPCWREADVIEEMISSCRQAWKHPGCTFYVGCYRNDPGTIESAHRGASGDERVRITALDRDGPTTKADCLNGLYDALSAHEARHGWAYEFVLMQDAEDRVHPLALDLIADRLQRADFVQLPVIAELDPDSRWVAGHYADEFSESHFQELGCARLVGHFASRGRRRMCISPRAADRDRGFSWRRSPVRAGVFDRRLRAWLARKAPRPS